MHLADAFIQSDLHCIQVTVFTFDQLFIYSLNYFKEDSLAHQGCIYLIKKYSKNSNIVKYY